MESQYKNGQIIRFLYFLFLVSACTDKVNPKEQIYNVSLAQNGDIIYRLGNGLFSNFFKDFSKRDKKFSHVGIIYKTENNDTTFVIHAEADDFSGIGYVKKEPVAIFLSDAKDWAIYRFNADKGIQKKISEYAFQYHQKKIPFDTAFEIDDSSAFYCTELVGHCINNALQYKVIKSNTVMKSRAYIATDDTYLIDDMKLIMANSNNVAVKY